MHKAQFCLKMSVVTGMPDTLAGSPCAMIQQTAALVSLHLVLLVNSSLVSLHNISRT